MSLSVEKILRKAQSHLKAGELAEAEELYKRVLSQFPKNMKAIQGYQKAKAGITSKGALTSGPPREQVQELFHLYNQDQFEEVLSKIKPLIGLFPKAVTLLNLSGASHAALLKLDTAIDSYKQALRIKPDYFEAHINLGNALKDKGDLTAAVHSYQQAINIKPDYADAYYNLGTALEKMGDLDAAICNFKKSLNIHPNSAKVYNSIGTSLKEKGDLDAAIDSYKQALKVNPNYAEAYNNMGIALIDKGDLDAAIDSYKQALKIKPDYAETHTNMGAVLNQKGEIDAAIVSLKQAIKIKPEYAEASYNMGVALMDKGDLDAAIDSYKQALKIKPNNASVHNNIGIALQKKGEPDAAVESFKQALKIRPDYPEAHSNMGNALRNKVDPTETSLDAAIDHYKLAIKIKPDYAEAYSNMGNALRDKNDLDAAIENYKQALKVKPDYAEAHTNMGVALMDKGDLDVAIISLNQAIKINPDYADAHWNLSLISNLQGELKSGFELYEWRFKKSDAGARPARTRRVWDGKQALNGKKFSVYEEQGLGDTIQFCRYLQLLEGNGAKVTFKVKPQLHKILGTLDAKLELLTEMPSGDSIDFESPLLSLPYLFGTQLNSIPAPSPYLFADEDKVKFWNNRFSDGSFKIGICWQGSKSKVDIGRSFPLSLFKDIANVQNMELINLHKGEGENQMDAIDFDVTTLGPDFDANQDAFLDSAAVMMNCDLIITSDTAIAHLAGALGRPTWVVLKHIPDWRWMLGSPDSVWYPTMNLYRQKNQGDWTSVFDTIKQDLLFLIDQK